MISTGIFVGPQAQCAPRETIKSVSFSIWAVSGAEWGFERLAWKQSRLQPGVQTYSSAGLPATSKINAVMALVNDGAESIKGSAKSGGVWIDQNPAETAGGNSFDYGDASDRRVPSGSSTDAGPVSVNPLVNVSGSPVLAARKPAVAPISVEPLAADSEPA